MIKVQAATLLSSHESNELMRRTKVKAGAIYLMLELDKFQAELQKHEFLLQNVQLKQELKQLLKSKDANEHKISELSQLLEKEQKEKTRLYSCLEETESVGMDNEALKEAIKEQQMLIKELKNELVQSRNELEKLEKQKSDQSKRSRAEIEQLNQELEKQEFRYKRLKQESLAYQVELEELIAKKQSIVIPVPAIKQKTPVLEIDTRRQSIVVQESPFKSSKPVEIVKEVKPTKSTFSKQSKQPEIQEAKKTLDKKPRKKKTIKPIVEEETEPSSAAFEEPTSTVVVEEPKVVEQPKKRRVRQVKPVAETATEPEPEQPTVEVAAEPVTVKAPLKSMTNSIVGRMGIFKSSMTLQKSDRKQALMAGSKNSDSLNATLTNILTEK